jgi:hypothetical protein
MAYENPNRIKYAFGTFDFGGGAPATYAIAGPKGKNGVLWDYGVEGVTEAFGGTTPASISVGKSGSTAAFGAAMSLGDVLISTAKSVRTLYTPVEAGFAMLITDKNVPAGTTVLVTCTVASGGTPAGQGVPFVIIDWQD